MINNQSANIYAQKAVSQIPRLLSSQDRNPFSPTYGCFNREYWLNRTRDFPDAIAQYSTSSLALVWAHKIPGGEQYYHNEEVKKAVIAGIRFWIKIQHRDGSFDEFYENERGWAGPTGFLLYAMIKSYELLGNQFPRELKNEFLAAAQRSAEFLSTREETGVLANHYAMALLPIYATYYHAKGADPVFDQKLLRGFHSVFKSFLSYCNEEGWSLEYDGADPGYLSGTVSFLSKLQKYTKADKQVHTQIQSVIDKAVEFCSYFIYPNGSYAGTIGSRQTLHFYAHGFELQAANNPLAAACAYYGRESLSAGRLVPPEIQGDRYFLYRIPEFLEAFIDASDTVVTTELPFQRSPFEKYFPNANIVIKNTRDHYILINLVKGGAMKIFNKPQKTLVYADDGLVAISNGNVYTTQWVDSHYTTSPGLDSWTVSGQLHRLKYDYFNTLTMIIFKVFMLMTGWNARVADKIKGLIRDLLVTKSASSGIHFNREFTFSDSEILIKNTIKTKRSISYLRVGGQFATRYVPQSRYFQVEELKNQYLELNQPALPAQVTTRVNLKEDQIQFKSETNAQ